MIYTAFLLGLITAGRGKLKLAEDYFSAAFKTDATMSDAAFSLCLLNVQAKRPLEALPWCQKAAEITPDEPKFSFSLALLLLDTGNKNGALATLSSLNKRVPRYAEAYLFRGELLENEHDWEGAAQVYRQLLALDGISEHYLAMARKRLDVLPEMAEKNYR